MATLVSHPVGTQRPTELDPQAALHYAWSLYISMLVLPFLLFIYIGWSIMAGSSTTSRVNLFGDRWFLFSVAYMVLVVPATFFIRSRMFKAYWEGQAVAPKAYLNGMMIMWIALEIGGLLSLFGCLATGSLLPNLLPALGAFMMYVALWPSGRAMLSHGRGASDDPERYEEPR